MVNKLSYGLLPLFAAASIYSLSSGFRGGADFNFFQDPALFNKFEDPDFIYKTSIENDPTNVRDYLLNNSVSMLWSKDDGKHNEDISSNGFIINILTDQDDEYSYSPKYYDPSTKLTFLVGTSLSFAKDLFDKVNDWKTEVNEASSSIKLKDKTNKTSNKFYISHPFPVSTERNIMEQDHLYFLGSPDYYKQKDFLLKKSHYVQVEQEDVELLYGAMDLEINKRLLDLDLQRVGGINDSLNTIHNDVNNEFVSEISTLSGNKYKFFADFAVLKISMKVEGIKQPYLSHIRDSFLKKNNPPSVIKGNFPISGGKTGSMYMGGWSYFDPKQYSLHRLERALVEFKVKQEKESEKASKKPSEVSADGARNQYLELKLSDQSDNKDNFEIKNQTYYPNDEDGVLFVRYEIHDDKGNHVVRRSFLSGFQKATTDNTRVSSLYATEEQDIKDRQEFVKAKPDGKGSWREIEFKYTYFPYSNLRQELNHYIIFGNHAQLGNDIPPSIVKINDKDYLNVSHHVLAPNLDIGMAKGMPVLSHNGSQNFLAGMYAGRNRWMNILDGNKYTGKIMLFLSPWRYDLFNNDNKLSKPTVGSSLKRKGLDKKLIYRNVFKS